MPTAEGLRTQKQIRKSLKGAGVHLEIVHNPRPTMQWYRADGTPLPNLLPADEHHRGLYLKKGWTMFPPQVTSHVHRYNAPVGSPCKAVDGCPVVRRARLHKRKAVHVKAQP